MADRICVMDHGRVVQVGTPEEIYWRPVDSLRGALLRRQELLPGRLGARDGPARTRAIPPSATCLPPTGRQISRMARPSISWCGPRLIRLDGSPEPVRRARGRDPPSPGRCSSSSSPQAAMLPEGQASQPGRTARA